MTKTVRGIAFINRNIDKIERKSRQFIPRNVRAVTIVANFEDEDASQFSNGITARPVRRMKSNPVRSRTAKARTVPSSSAALVLVRTKEAGTYMVKATPTENDGNLLSITKKIVETLPQQPFYITVANSLKEPVRFPNNMKVTMLGNVLSRTVFVQKKVPVDHFSAVSIY